MTRVRNIIQALEQIAPERLAFPFDRVGFQIGDPDAEVRSAAVSLDSSVAAVNFALERSAQVLISHHPLLFEPVSNISVRTRQGRTIQTLIENKISFVAAHTNWDSAQGGINDTLVQILNLLNPSPFGYGAEVARLKVVVTAPTDALGLIIDAAASAGAGVIGKYSRCAFSVTGRGVFTAGVGASPSVGQAGSANGVEEERLEMVLPSSCKDAVYHAICEAHPYETPSVEFLMLAPSVELPAGRVGELERSTTLEEFSNRVGLQLQTSTLTWGDRGKAIRKVALVGGAADGEWQAALAEGADVLVTGEVKQHNAVDASESGLALICAGHYATEHPGCSTLRDRLSERLPEVEWELFVPQPGLGGRPF